MDGKITFVILTVFAGAAMALQAPINAALSKATGVLESSCISFSVGTLALLLLVFFFGDGNIWAMKTVPWYLLTGGLCGVAVVTCSVYAIPKLGSLLVIAALVAGQMAAGLLIDYYGLLGLAVQPITISRLGGMALILSGLALILHK